MINNYQASENPNKADIIGWFSGHIHRDRIYEGVSVNDTDDSIGAPLGFKQITITSDANLDYDWLADTANRTDLLRNMSNDTSHAIDFITINKTTKDVNLTRLGMGGNRHYSYKK